MSVQSLLERIDRLFEAEGSTHPDRITALLDRLHVNYSEAMAKSTKRFVVLLVVWFLGYLVSAGFVVEGQIGSVRVERVKDLLVIWPPLLGLLGYGVISSMAGAILVWGAIRRAYRHYLPTLHAQNLEALLIMPTFLDIERLADPGHKHPVLRRVSDVSLSVVVIALITAPAAAIVHVSFLLFKAGQPHWLLVLLSVLLGGLLWLAGLSVLARSMPLLDSKEDANGSEEPQQTPL